MAHAYGSKAPIVDGAQSAFKPYLAGAPIIPIFHYLSYQCDNSSLLNTTAPSAVIEKTQL